MAKISITSETARRIVEVGTESVYSSVQELKKPERTQRKVQQAGHLKGATLSELLEENERLPALTNVIISKNLRTGGWEIIHWREHHGHYVLQTTRKLTGPNQSDLITFPDGFQRYVSCPLLRPNDSIEKGATVIVSYNEQTKKYEIIETPCPAASAAALPDEGEEEQQQTDDPEGGE